MTVTISIWAKRIVKISHEELMSQISWTSRLIKLTAINRFDLVNRHHLVTLFLNRLLLILIQVNLYNFVLDSTRVKSITEIIRGTMTLLFLL